jgi:hypothetical protein
MQHACAHVSQLAELLVGDGLDDLRIFHDVRVGNQETGNIGPVLVQVCVDRAGHDGTGHIGTAAGEGLDAAVVL